MQIKSCKIIYHRNGVQGEPFYAVSFTHEHDILIATVTGEKGGCHVINPGNLGMCYRGDTFEKALRGEIILWYSHEFKVNLKRAMEELNDGLTEKVY